MIFDRKPIFYVALIFLSVCIFQSCIPKNKFLFVFNRTSVKNPPKDTTPFVFANEIKIEPGVIAKDEQNRLESELNNYWDDTVKARSLQQFGVFYRIKKPQRFDTIGLQRSLYFMNSYLQSQGYYNAMLQPDADTFIFKRNSKPATALIGGVVGGAVGNLLSKDQPIIGGAIGTLAGAGLGYGVGSLMDRNARKQFRVTSIMKINPGKRLKFDSIAYDLMDTVNKNPADTILQHLTNNIQEESFIKTGDPYSKQNIASELDRLVKWYRQNGFYKIRREHLAALVDTTDQLTDSVIIDPFELARVTAEVTERRRQNPTADVTIMQATQAKNIPYDSSVVKQYYIGNIFYYPETNATTDIPDTLLAKGGLRSRANSVGTIILKHKDEKPLFRMKPFLRNTYLTKGELYDEHLFFRTVNTMSQMGPWQRVDVRDSIRNDTIDFHIFLSPYKRYNHKEEFELTRSTGDFASSSNLFGIGGNVTVLDRNFQRRAKQLSIFARGGIELNLNQGDQLLQTVQFGTGGSYVTPHLTARKFWSWWGITEKKLDGARTVLNVNANYTDRRDFFRLRSFVANYGWEFRRKNKGYSFRIPNIELYSLDTLPLLSAAFRRNPFLQTAFNTGSVLGLIGTFNYNWPARKNIYLKHFFRVGGEYAGLPVVFSSSLKDNFYHYIKAEAEYIAKWQKPKTEFLARIFTGAGFNLINDPVLGKSLPFFKQFVAGGPNSMRGWGLRQLGLGSSILSETATDFKDRFGDFQLEANIEYRFQLADLGGAKFSSAIFTDIGNIWNLKEDVANPRGQFKFNPRRVYDDLAMALGTGLRMNVANFILRVDFAIKLKDPVRTENNNWLDFGNFSWKNQYGNNNYAVQIGIGLPF